MVGARPRRLVVGAALAAAATTQALVVVAPARGLRVTHLTQQARQRRRVISMEFHAEGDASGDYLLSGLWQLTTRRQAERRLPSIAAPAPHFSTNHQNRKRRDPYRSWSGSAFASPARASVPDISTTIVSLKSRGVFESPPDSQIHYRGSWSCDGREVTLARFGRGRQVVEWFVGEVREVEAEADILRGATAGSIRGHIGYGAHEPEYAGTFTMKQVLPQFNPLKKREIKGDVSRPFDVSSVVGTYSLQLTTAMSASFFVVELRPDLTWETVSGVAAAPDATPAEGATSSSDDDDATSSSSSKKEQARTRPTPRLAGKWNVYRDSIDLSSGIPGEGRRIWIWLRRFGTGGGRVSTGVALNEEHLFMGKIRESRSHVWEDADVVDADETTPLPALAVRDARGDVAVGWSIEPAFIGRFHLRPWRDNAPTSDDD